MDKKGEKQPGILDGMAEHRREGEAVTYVGMRDGKLAAIGWRSHKKEKPDFRYTFKTAEKRDEFLADWWDKLARLLSDREARRAKTAARRERIKAATPDRPNPFKEGDVLTFTSGSDGGHCDCYPRFYQVLSAKPKSVIVQQIHKEIVEEDPRETQIQGVQESHVVARRNIGELGSKPEMKVVKWDDDGKPYLQFWPCYRGYLWDGRKLFAAWGWN